MTPSWLEFVAHADARAALVAIKGGRDLPFGFPWVYAMTGMSSGAVRGGARPPSAATGHSLSGGFVPRVAGRRGRADRGYAGGLGAGAVSEAGGGRELSEFLPDCVPVVFADRLYGPVDLVVARTEFLSLAGSGGRRWALVYLIAVR